MTFAADKNCAEFGGVKLFVEEYTFSRSAATGENILIDGTVSLYSGGGKAVKIKLVGTAENSCADKLDTLLCGGARLTLSYAGMTFEDVILSGYTCSGKSGASEKVTAEFSGEAAAVKEENDE